MSEQGKLVAILLIKLQLDKETRINLGNSNIIPIKKASPDVAGATRLGADMQEYTGDMPLNWNTPRVELISLPYSSYLG